MFVGHYSASFWAKAKEDAIPLWLLFLAVQLVDVLWAIFVLLGIEKVRIVPGITATSPLDLYYMPYTHSLIGALGWSVLAWLLCQSVPRLRNARTGLIMGAAVFSHWVLDLIVHRPDLPLYDNHFKMGFGLWNYRGAAFSLELAVLWIGIYLYLRAEPGKWRVVAYGILLSAVQWMGTFRPRRPASDHGQALMLLFFYFLFALIAWWAESGRARTARVAQAVAP